MKTFLALAAASMIVFNLNAQIMHTDDHLTCLNNYNYFKYCQEHGIDPNNNPTVNAYEAYTKEYVDNFAVNEAAHGRATYIVPVVFHIVHLGGVENISDAQIQDEIAILNRDYNKLNPDTTDVIGPFKPIVANIQFEFRLAQKDALGNCVSGITRHYSTTTDNGDQSTVDAVNQQLNGSSSTSSTHYPRNMYLNIWVVRYAQGAAGYTNTPPGAAFSPSKYDGIWVLHNYVGSIGTSAPSHSRCLTHEIGHWFNLNHCWGPSNNPGCDGTIMTAPCSGDDNCTTDDGVTDTPNTIGWASCNLAGATCGSPHDNVQNYMEYSYCTCMFTAGQKARMHASITSSTCSRNNLWTTSNLNATGTNGTDILCAADFTSDQTIICAGDSIAFSDLTYHGPTTWNWNFGAAGTSTVQNPTVTFNTTGQYNVSLTAGNGITNVSTTKNTYVTVLDPVGAWPFDSEGFEGIASLPTSKWLIYNSDGQQQWQIQSGVGSSGTKCMKLDNFTFNNAGGKDMLLSETYNMSGATSIHISFKYAYKQRTSADIEKLKLSVSSNCGLSWSVRKQVNGSVLSAGAVQTTAYTTPAPGDWQLYDVTSIPATFFTQGFRFRIEFESDNGNNIYIDDINLDITVGTEDIMAHGVNFNVYPNPANSFATIAYELPTAQDIEIAVTDVLGKRVMLVEKGQKIAGEHKATLNTAALPSKGIYFVTIYSNGVSRTQKLVIE